MESTSSLKAEASPLYRELADQVLRLITRGTFRPGERIPSVRGLSRQRKVSITTVLEAYRLLEDSGYIEARPQSGYFVRPRLLRLPEEPEATSPPRIPGNVSNQDLLAMVLRDAIKPGVVPLGAALPPAEHLPSETLGRTLARIARRSRNRLMEPAAGAPELRAQIARRALDAGCALTPQDILTTNGCQEAVYFALSATCRPGDTVVVESPTYFGFLQVIDALGLRVLELRSYPRHGLCLDELSEALRKHRVRACLLALSHANPLGSCMPEDKREKLVSMLAEKGIPLIEDDINGDLGHAGGRPKAAKAFDEEGLVLLCSSFSKTLAPGYRVGWIAPGRFGDAILRLKTLANFANPTPTQLAIADFLANGGYDRHLRKFRRALANNVAMVTQAVSLSFPEGTRVTRPSGGFVIWAELPGSCDGLEVYERALKAGITIAPGPLFSAKGAYRNFIRLNAGSWSDRVRQAVVTLGKLASRS